MMESAVTVSGIDMVFNQGTNSEVHALKGIDLRINKGDFVSLIGPSGCGKSTLLRLVGDLLVPTAGSISVFGKPAHQARLDRDYGMAFQSAGLFDWRTISQNIELPLELMEVPAEKRTARSREMLAMVKLDEFGDHYPWQLSGGMQQRVALARSLSFAPELLLMDEPFGALDEMTREYMQTELLAIQRDLGTTVVFVTHSIAESVLMSDQVVVMSARPGAIHSVIDVNLGERSEDTRQSPEFFKLTSDVRTALRAGEGTP